MDLIPAGRRETEGGSLSRESHTVVRKSLAVGFWVVVSRVTGVGRVAATAAVLGLTYLGNTFQAMNLLPNLAFEFLAGSLFGSLLVPRLVHHVDGRDARSTERFANGFLGMATLAFAVLTLLAILAGPLVLRLFTLGVGDPTVAAAQRRVGALLLALLMPQMLLYGMAAIGAAVMNARGRFALAAAAPALENIGVIVTLVLTAALFGTGVDIGDVTGAHVVLLGAGTTAAVGLHAAAMWWGARRAGVVLRPRAGWRDPEVLQLARRAIPSLGYVWLSVLGYFALLVVANRVPGGVVAFQLAMNFCAFPVAVGAEPVMVAVRPQLARLYREGRLQAFRDQLVRAGALVSFLTVPAAVFFLALAVPLAHAVAVGEMATSTGVQLVSSSIAAIALAVVGESVFRLIRDASYARDETRAPFVAMLVRTAVSMSIVVAGYAFLDGPALLAALGLSFSAGSLAGAWNLARHVRSGLSPGTERLSPSLVRIFAGSVLIAGPVHVIATHPVIRMSGQPGEIVAMLSAVVAGLAMFLALQRLWGSSELRALLSALRQARPGEAGR